jgi:glyoxylase-like metal-dependent hydrolase (beta-lactamase superfamily II)
MMKKEPISAAIRFIALFSLLASVPTALAEKLALAPTQVAPNVYVVVGALGAQTYENDGLNNNPGFVIGENGVLVINSGPSISVAKALHQAIEKITKLPVKWVVNVNSQNHNWHGNGYFKSIGAKILSHREADRVMRETGEAQLETSKAQLKDKFAGTTLTYATETVGDKYELALGGITVQLLHFGPAHTPGDMVVWLPQQKIVFTGDIVFTERLLGILETGSSANWIRAFDQIASLHPQIVIPGHGRPTGIEQARRDTRDYLAFLCKEIKQSLDKGESIQDAVDRIDQSRFKHLKNFDALAKRNANRVYLEMEKEAF